MNDDENSDSARSYFLPTDADLNELRKIIVAGPGREKLRKAVNLGALYMLITRGKLDETQKIGSHV